MSAAANSKIANEESIAFSKLVLATGSTPLRLNVPGADLAGVHTFRDSRDVDLLLTLAAQRSASSWSAADCWDWKRPTALPRPAQRST